MNDATPKPPHRHTVHLGVGDVLWLDNSPWHIVQSLEMNGQLKLTLSSPHVVEGRPRDLLLPITPASS